jgi:TRAP-type C4-dicarboxylate transport system substrate-binding protein
MKQTSIEWLIDAMENPHKNINWEDTKQQAKEMHKQEHSKTWDKALDTFEERGHSYVRAWIDFDEYYQEKFKGGELETFKQETLYTEEQVISIVEKSRATGLTAEYIIQSLKQPKQ